MRNLLALKALAITVLFLFISSATATAQLQGQAGEVFQTNQKLKPKVRVINYNCAAVFVYQGTKFIATVKRGTAYTYALQKGIEYTFKRKGGRFNVYKDIKKRFPLPSKYDVGCRCD